MVWIQQNIFMDGRWLAVTSMLAPTNLPIRIDRLPTTRDGHKLKFVINFGWFMVHDRSTGMNFLQTFKWFMAIC